jgi:hypothetical protein
MLGRVSQKMEILRKLRRLQELEVKERALAESMAQEGHIQAADRLAELDYLIKELEEIERRESDEIMQKMMDRGR